jgi:hypothetical protein
VLPKHAAAIHFPSEGTKKEEGYQKREIRKNSKFFFFFLFSLLTSHKNKELPTAATK